MQNKKINFLLCFFLGFIGVFSFSPYNYWFIAIISISGLFFIIYEKNKIETIILGYIWGLGLFGHGIHWLYISLVNFSNIPNIINIFLLILLIMYLSIYPALFTFFLSYFISNKSSISYVFCAPVIWHIVEWFRGKIFTGFPWLQFGYTQIDGPLKIIAPILGVEGITFILIIISALFVYAIFNKKLIFFIIASFFIFIPQFLQKIKWYTIKNNSYLVNVTLIQGNIDNTIQWNKKKIHDTLNIYYKLSCPYFKKSSIIIWPESAIPDIENNQQEFIKSLDYTLLLNKTSLITGIIYSNMQDYYNSIIILGNKHYYNYFYNQRYKKHHLVPFGEFLPLRKFLLFNLPISNFSKGNYFQSQLKVKKYKITTAICYEIIFGKQLRDNFDNTTDFLVNISNDSWFGNSIGPWQHFQMARMRALELGRPLLRSSNNGITAVINANGEIQKLVPQFIPSTLNTDIQITTGLTPYAMFGSNLLWIIVFIFLVISIILKKYIY